MIWERLKIAIQLIVVAIRKIKWDLKIIKFPNKAIFANVEGLIILNIKCKRFLK